MFKITTIFDGERVIVWNKAGQARAVDGPKRLILFREEIEQTVLFAAQPDQYLVIRHKNGTTEHVAGPAAVWLDPVNHEKIYVEPAIKIDANEAVVVYRRTVKNVERRVVRGPALFVPQADEWLHQFSWHGADAKQPAHRKVPHALKFTKLLVIPDQMYLNVENVRTADDALLMVKLMVFFELENIERMLDQTHDPIADFINALSADVIDFAAALSFEKFKEATERLNQLETFPQLVQRAARIGYQINKVVYRGYYANDKLQSMHDSAIEVRTHLRLEAETEKQAQELADLKLEREALRAEQQRQMEEAKIVHQNHLKRLEHDEALRQQKTEREEEIDGIKSKNQVEIEHQEALHRDQVGYLKEMRGIGVDLTRYLIAQYQNPDKVIRIDGDRRPALHLHE